MCCKYLESQVSSVRLVTLRMLLVATEALAKQGRSGCNPTIVSALLLITHTHAHLHAAPHMAPGCSTSVLVEVVGP